MRDFRCFTSYDDVQYGEGQWRFAAGVLSLHHGVWGSNFPSDRGYIDMITKPPHCARNRLVVHGNCQPAAPRMVMRESEQWKHTSRLWR
jgi:hypothetical protein